MGYETYFMGYLQLDKPLEKKHSDYLLCFVHTRRMKRDPKKLEGMPDPVREAAGLPIGEEGDYYVGSTENYGQERTDDIVEYNCPPNGQPSLWCPWEPIDENAVYTCEKCKGYMRYGRCHNCGWEPPGSRYDQIGIEEGGKHYDYVEWLEYLIYHFFGPWGYTLNGETTWTGEEPDDRGTIYVKDNRVEAVEDLIQNPGPSWEQ